MSGITLRFVAPTDTDAMAGEHDLRFRVLREPLGFTRADVAFPFDDESVHLHALRDGAVVGCVLFHPESSGDESSGDGAATEGRLYQMAVDPALQGQGIGRQLVAALEERLAADGVRRVTLHARGHALGFYARLGYEVEGAPFEEVGIPHRHMAKQLMPAKSDTPEAR